MKKTNLLVLAMTMISVGVLAQGSIVLSDADIGPGVATDSADNGAAWFSGNLSLQVWWAPGTNSNIAAINAAYLSGDSGVGYSLVENGEFVDEANVTVYVDGGTFTYNALGLALPNIPSDTVNTFVLVGSAQNGGLNGFIAFTNSDGGNLAANGQPAALSGWNAINQDLVMIQDGLPPPPIPEPTPISLASVGGLSLWLFRCRRNPSQNLAVNKTQNDSQKSGAGWKAV